MKFLLFDRNENYISTLKDVISARHTEEINGEDILEISTLDQKVAKEYRIAYKSKYGFWKEFIVKEIRENHTADGIVKNLFCESSFYETLGDFVEDKRPSGGASGALLNALETTRWEVGRVDNLGEGATSFYRTSAKESVQKVAETWKGEIQTRVEIVGNKITHRYVDLLAKRGGDFGKRFTYTKDLESVTKIVHRDDVITALYGYGKGEQVGDGFGRRIDFSKINNDKAYVENLDALNIWGRNNPDGTKSHVFGKVEFDECEDEVELLALTGEKLEELSEPLITYECSVIDLGGAELGDRVRVIDKEFEPELRLNARVIKIVRDLLSPEKNNITLGNFIPSIEDIINGQESFINNFRSKQGVWDRSDIINQDGTINAQFLNNLVDEINNKMNSQGGYVFISEEGQGLITTNKPTIEESTEAIQLVGGGFRIANSKNPDGTFSWRTFGTGDGFTADEITAGMLKGIIISNGDGTFYVDELGNMTATSGAIGGFNLFDNGLDVSFSETFGPFTQADKDRVTNIIVGNITPTESDLKKYDLTRDGRIGTLDILYINRVMEGVISPDVTYKVSIRSDDAQRAFSFERVGYGWNVPASYMGVGGISTQSINATYVDSDSVEAGTITSKGEVYTGNGTWQAVSSPILNKVWGLRDSITYLHVDADSGAWGIAWNPSDRKWKEDIKDSSIDGLDVINLIKHREFSFKEDSPVYPGKHNEVGYIAQELEEIREDFVLKIAQFKNDDVTDYNYQVNDSKMMPYVTKAIQELSEKLDNIDNRLKAIENGVAR